MIKRKNNKYMVLSEKTGRSFGSYRTLAAAKKRLRQIEFFKHLAKTGKRKRGFVFPMVMLLVVGLLTISVGTAYLVFHKPQNGRVACTQEAKLCPDGSAVGRTGPNCEFACPEPTEGRSGGSTSSPQFETDISNWKTYRNEKYGFEMKYPPDFKMNIDLRLIGPHGNLYFDVKPVQFDPAHIIDDQQPVDKIELIKSSDKNWYEYGYSDAGCGNSVYQSDLKGNTIRVSFFSCVDAHDKPLLSQNQGLQNQILSTFKFIKSTELKEQNPLTIPYGDKIGWIKNVYVANGKTYMDFDRIEFFYGDAAVSAKKADGACEENEGDPCFTPHGYYIRNNDKTTTTLEIVDIVTIKVFEYGGPRVTFKTISLQEFLDAFFEGHTWGFPIWIKQDEYDRVTSIVNQYMP